METITLTDAQWSTVVNGLRAAADLYSTSAHQFDMENQPRLAEQFRKQRAEALALACSISEQAGV